MSGATTDPLFHRYIPPAEITRHHCRRLYIPDHEQYRAAINELLSRLMIREVWEATSFTMSADEAASLAGEMLNKFWRDDCMIGTIIASVRETTPDWALPLDGSDYLQADYPELMEVLDGHYKFYDGAIGKFYLPDLRGRFIMGSGNDDYPLYDEEGSATHTLTTSELPSHSHYVAPHNHGITTYINIPVPAGVDPVFASSMVDTPGATLDDFGQNTSDVGGGDPLPILPPYSVIRYIIVVK